jgi:AraC family transcriptional regulator of adaptative response/methylated-DNA-[protein]-cysteine methyltransferase
VIQDNDHYWDIFTRKDARYDGLFFVGVMSTKIYCRPTCSARPARKNVRFFATIHDAESAGLRPCKRCTPHTLAPDKQLCELVCRIIEQSAQAPDLASIATLTGYSKFHLLRTFKRIMGITPFAYTQIVRSLRFHQNMTQITSVTDALLDAGYGSPSAYYYAQKHARNLTIITTSDTYVIGHCRYAGFDVVGVFNERGVVYCGIYSDMTSAEAEFRTRHGIDVTVIDQAYSNLLHALIHRQALEQPVALISDAATPFQRDVWHVIRDIPEGETLSYRALAERIGRPTAIRAVANACAQNPHAVITPCHRIIGADHNPGGYRWGTSLKSALLTYERANYYNERSDN